MTIPWDSLVDCLRQIGFLPKDGNESLSTVMSLIFFFFICFPKALIFHPLGEKM